MKAALGLARRGLGSTWPNPSVGCVLVKDGQVVGRGWTQPGGRPHAETEALGRAGARAKGATAYVTLEPCNHHGKTPPCAQALIDAGVARCVSAVTDPDPRVAGQGLERMKAAGIEVSSGLLEAEAAEINEGFFKRITEGRPLFTLKAATTLDGRIAAASGASKWITGPEARARGHLLRASHDAILVGIGTALADDPELTCRLPGLAGRSPVRVVLDGHGRLAPTSKLVATADEVPTWVVTSRPRDDLPEVEVLTTNLDADGRLDVTEVAQRLAAEGLTRVLIEGGGRIAGAFMKAGLVDRLAWFQAPMVMGGDGLAAVASMEIETPNDAPSFVALENKPVGKDRLGLYTTPTVIPTKAGISKA